MKKKLIEVALPLEAINKASAREKSIRHGHPSTLHLWWARRPLAAARAVIFSQMVDDPSSYPDLFPTEKKQEKERQRLFKIIEDLVQWENTTNEEVLQRAREEIWQSWRRECAENVDHPRAKELFDRYKLPAFHDPFAGGGALPLEAQRLGLEAYASDLNPVAVLINKAMIEIPPKFAGKLPINPEARKDKTLIAREWKGAQGLAEDVRYYGKWMRDEAEKRIGHLYPKVEVMEAMLGYRTDIQPFVEKTVLMTEAMARGRSDLEQHIGKDILVTDAMTMERPDLKPLIGKKLTVIAWLWARTVKSPNPAFANVDVPLASSFMLSTKAGKEAYIEPVIEGNGYRFTVKMGKPKDAEGAKNGTKLARGANFKCLMSGAPISGDYIKAEGKAKRMGMRMLAIIAESERGRVFLAPTSKAAATAREAQPEWQPDSDLVGKCRDQLPLYGMNTFAEIFTPRQLVGLTTLSDLVTETRERVKQDAMKAGLPDDGKALEKVGAGAMAYAEAVGMYLGLALSRTTNTINSLAVWSQSREQSVNLFSRQAVPMTWDFPEVNPFGGAAGDFGATTASIGKTISNALSNRAWVVQADAQTQDISRSKVVSTDPPYYDNICYADLSDFFYVWLRRSMKAVFPGMFSTMAVPKVEELVASPYRYSSKGEAETFFLDGMRQAMHRLAEEAHPAFPVTIYYAFKQAESDGADGTTNTGWDTFLAAVIEAGFAISGTWPMRTERPTGVKVAVNSLASSIVLVCRQRRVDAPTTTRREFLTQLKAELPMALAHLQKGNIAPVDLAQAAIGPGMAVYTRYAKVLDAEGKPLSVREALALINQTLDEALAEQEGDFDADTRWALAWFEQSGFSEGEFGVADVLARAKNTAVDGLVEAGIVSSSRGKVRLLKPDELSDDWDPTTDPRLTAWEMVNHLIRVLEAGGEGAAAGIVAKLGSKAEVARELCYRLYTLCERKKRASEALAYNALVQSWPEIIRLAREGGRPQEEQTAMFGGE